jgi:hypothetical protein
MHWPEVPRMASAPSRVARLAEKPTDLGESQILDSRVRHGFGMEHTDVPGQRTVSPPGPRKNGPQGHFAVRTSRREPPERPPV